MDHSETSQQEHGKESNHKLENTSREPTNHKPAEEGGDAPDTLDANMKDAPSCQKCGKIFPWDQLQLRWKHNCDPTEVTRTPRPRTQSSAAAVNRTVPKANTEVVNETGSTRQVCGCGKTFTDNQGIDFVKHKLQCPEGAPLSPPVAERRARGATLK